MEACLKVHSRTIEFRKDNDGKFNTDTFRDKLSEKLRNRSLDKVAIAMEVCLAIKKLPTALDIKETDTAYYLVKAINHVCYKR